jgi:hypothetical protein
VTGWVLQSASFLFAQNLSDALRRRRLRQNHPSSPGVTGRSRTPRRLGSISSALEYWIPAGACHRAALGADPVAGMTTVFVES